MRDVCEECQVCLANDLGVQVRRVTCEKGGAAAHLCPLFQAMLSGSHLEFVVLCQGVHSCYCLTPQCGRLYFNCLVLVSSDGN